MCVCVCMFNSFFVHTHLLYHYYYSSGMERIFGQLLSLLLTNQLCTGTYMLLPMSNRITHCGVGAPYSSSSTSSILPAQFNSKYTNSMVLKTKISILQSSLYKKRRVSGSGSGVCYVAYCAHVQHITTIRTCSSLPGRRLLCL